MGTIAARPIETAREDVVCPFCAAPWTEAMFAMLDRATLASGCACCGGTVAAHPAPTPVPTEGINCAACGREIYRAVGQA
ncbi:hypothetical protein ACFO8O_15025 [Hephaestia sp. GCM10023244]|uniref:hypothetical protein n=1 Tax=unclassified Hephaestia TaxID=2631281 RepID=UPI0020778A7E|nr:hypothetical protein [Hephaestia sp. MAHUQ-44]MCM8732274.1 hypothetical protein [Hephaestia sp. MAHUQ-44]